ncbi:hypothetical protein ANN_14094 [Periplaneta americana]|uniref:Tc1-like transposase DDE domain-containing protein n=1 Tax=Periplaneta americana TaxID=6978 RepID=A0ABQ8SWS5_PERAM|nr:hypothetical protein ANN_14094 [Periplaneta americana]
MASLCEGGNEPPGSLKSIWSTNIKLQNGEIVSVIITSGDDDMTTIRVFNIPPEVPNDRITNTLMNYGKVQSIVNEKWTHKYRFAVDTGIRIVQMSVEKPIPSSLIIANYEADIAADCPELPDKIDVHRNTQPSIHDEVTNIQNESETDSADENDIVLVTENSSIENEDETPDNKRRKKERSEQIPKQTKSSSQETRDRLNVISPHGISQIHNPQPMIQDTGAAPSEDEGRIPSSQPDCIQDSRLQTLTATNNTMWSDEMEVVNLNLTREIGSPVRVYREDGIQHDQRYVHRRERSGRFSISYWGWMCYDGPGSIERIDGRFNAGTYAHILESIFLPSALEHFPEGTLLFQQDNHPVHYAASIQRWFQRRPEIEIINWPPKSPDLNVIENIWAELKKRRIATYADRRPQNRDELWNQVVDTWEDLPGD